MAYKRILTIQDISCLGQCSTSVALPILSACGCETCILPTAILSTHTGGFGTPAVTHMDEAVPGILRHWQSQKITFDAILVGYLGSTAAIQWAKEAMETLLAPGGILVVDPVLGDGGKLYAGLDESYVREMETLCARANWILPNLTEAALILGLPCNLIMDDNYVNIISRRFPGVKILLTGYGKTDRETGFLMRVGEDTCTYTCQKLPGNYSGTGDMFAAVFLGALMQGKSPFDAAKIAADFVFLTIENTIAAPAHWYGVKFEQALPSLIRWLELS